MRFETYICANNNNNNNNTSRHANAFISGIAVCLIDRNSKTIFKYNLQFIF